MSDDSNQAPTLVAKLAAVMGEVERFAKTERVSGGGASYAFASVDDMADAIRPKLAEAGIVITPEGTEIVEQGWHTRELIDRDGQADQRGMFRTVLKVTWLVTAGERIIINGPKDEPPAFIPDALRMQTVGEAMDTSDKATNKAHTAARKQLLVNLFLISTGDDPDSDRPGDSAGDAPRAASGGSPSPGQVKFATDLLGRFSERCGPNAALPALRALVSTDDRVKDHADAIAAAVTGEKVDLMPLDRQVVSDLIDVLKTAEEAGWAPNDDLDPEATADPPAQPAKGGAEDDIPF